ncbi:MAG: hypothetical protein C0390_04235 [Syntrophus sp. (in: bacteria)]|nr:hypothetical protein [Syntrophus sp. (in: bacteria)]
MRELKIRKGVLCVKENLPQLPPGDIAVLQEFPGAAVQIMQKLSIIEKVPAPDLRDAKDEMPVVLV